VKGALWIVLAAVLGGAAAGVVAVILHAPESAPQPPVMADMRPPDATLDPVFEPCAHCHQIGPGAHSMTGPSLQGVIGRKAGTLTGYPFSPAMRSSGLVWDAATLDRFIAAPQQTVPGSRMIFAGIDEPARRQALIAFIGRVNTALSSQDSEGTQP
jgi:cytochrome c